MALAKGRNATVQVSVDGSTWVSAGSCNAADCSLNGSPLDVTVFGDAWIAKIQGLKDAQWQISGFADSADTGQADVRAAFLNDSPLYVQVEFDPSAAAGSKGFSQQVIVSKVDVKAAANSTVDFAWTLDGTGTPTAV